VTKLQQDAERRVDLAALNGANVVRQLALAVSRPTLPSSTPRQRPKENNRAIARSSGDFLADRLDVAEQQVQRWEASPHTRSDQPRRLHEHHRRARVARNTSAIINELDETKEPR
jgi:hypothetical protein